MAKPQQRIPPLALTEQAQHAFDAVALFLFANMQRKAAAKQKASPEENSHVVPQRPC